MKLIEMLKLYHQQTELISLLKSDVFDIDINNSTISPKSNLNFKLNNSNCSLTIDSNFKIVKANCACLNFSRNKNCLHTTVLYALAVKLKYPKKYAKIYEELEEYIKRYENLELINRLAADLKSNLPYFNKIHLKALITQKSDGYYLSLLIGDKKDYVIKNIQNFIENIESKKYFEYGQQLAFKHSYEVLDTEAKEFYSFLINISHLETNGQLKLSKSQLLKIMEIFNSSGIYFKDTNGNFQYYKIVAAKAELFLDKQSLSIVKPPLSSELFCGLNYAYFLAQDCIYVHKFKDRNEAAVFNALFKAKDKKLSFVKNENEFISNLLPILKNTVTVDPDFYEHYRLPTVTINSYFGYQDSIITHKSVVDVEQNFLDTIYVKEIFAAYEEVIKQLGFVDDSLLDVERQYKFLTSNLLELKKFGEVYFESSLKKLKIKKKNRFSFNFKSKDSTINLEIKSSDVSLEEAALILEAYHRKEKYVKLKSDAILKIDVEEMKKLDCFLEDFNIEGKNLKLEYDKPQSYLLKLLNSQNENFNFDEEIKKRLKALKEYNTKKIVISEVFKPILRPYQIEAIKWLSALAQLGFGGVLADDMGLGKTLEIMAYITADQVLRPSIIVCPMSLVYNWENEINKWKLPLAVHLIVGQGTEREEQIAKINYNEKAVYITSYDCLRRDFNQYQGVFRFIVADEAQYIKNRNAFKATAIKQLKGEMKYALTGTPIENSLADLWSIFDFVIPNYLADYKHFKNRYENLILTNDEEALEILQSRVMPFILRRTKRDVLKELPDKLEEVYYCKFDDVQRKIYDAVVVELKNKLTFGGKTFLPILTKLRQICLAPSLVYSEDIPSAKLSLAMELIKRGLASQRKILVFSQFPSVFVLLSQMLEKEGIRYFVLSGATKADKRLELVREFNKNLQIGVFMLSLKAGGTGLNLTGADLVIHLDPWWNLAAENQATDRAYRIGQTKNVHVIKLISKDTVEENVLKLQNAKLQLSDSVIAKKPLAFTKEDIIKIID